MTSFMLREVMLAHLLLWGNSYCQIIRLAGIESQVYTPCCLTRSDISV